jgi:hypothetical protein
MSENATSSVPSPTLAPGKWIGLGVAAVVLAEGIWSGLASLTKSLLLPLMARAIGGDAQSPLGKGDFNIPDLFVALVELCLAGIVFLSLKIWATRGASPAPRVRRAPAPSRAVTEPAPSIVPRAAAPEPETSPAPVLPVPPPAISQTPIPPPPAPPPAISQAPIPPPPKPPPPPPPTPPPAAAKPKKPEKPKEVYYNIVGEPITPDEDE